MVNIVSFTKYMLNKYLLNDEPQQRTTGRDRASPMSSDTSPTLQWLGHL